MSSKKPVARLTCAAGLLLTELVPPAVAQSSEAIALPEPEPPQSSDQHPKTLITAPEYEAPTAPPERVTVVETTRSPAPAPAAWSAAEVARSRPDTPVIAAPERLPDPPAHRDAPPEPPTIKAKKRPDSAGMPTEPSAPPPITAVAPPDQPSIRLASIPLDTAPPPPPLPNTSPPISTRAQDLVPSANTPTLPNTPALANSPTLSNTPTLANTPTSTPTPQIQPKVGATFTTGPGVGYESSFTGLRGLVPITQQPGRSLTFTQGQATVETDEGKVGGSVILGHRIYDQSRDRVFGGYVGYDHRSTSRNGFNQLGVGLETLGKTWDARINAYLPVGSTRQLASETVNTFTSAPSAPFFQGNFLAQTQTVQQQITQQFEAAAAGVDLEAGGKLANLGDFGELRGYGGLYYFGAPQGEGAVGVRTRLEARANENVQVGVALSHDRNYGTNVALSVGVTFPTVGSSRKAGERAHQPVLARLDDFIDRNANIVLDQQTESQTTTTQTTTFVTNPATGQPWRFRHAIPGVGTGNGTFENPTGTLAEALAVAQPDDIVYVQPGTNPGIPAFTIPDRVQVLSTGPIQRIDTVEFGPNYQLPLSGAGVLPTVLGTVTMGNSTTLSGFAIRTATGPGILGNGVNQMTIRDNAIANTADAGIALNNVGGTVTITDNSIQQAAAEGVLLTNDQGAVNLLLSRNQITTNGISLPDGDGVAVQLRNGATGTFTVTNNTIANNGTPGSLADGLDIKLFNGSSGTFAIADNTVSGNQANGLTASLEATAQGTLNLARNTLSNNQLSGVDLLLSDGAQAQVTLDSNAIANNRINGAQIVAANQSNATLNLTANTITGNQDNGVLLQSSDAARISATLLNNGISNNTNSGVITSVNGTSQQRLLLQGNTISGNGLTGVSIGTFDFATTAAALRSNTITGNTFADVDVLNLSPSATTCLQPLTNTIGSLLLDDSAGFAGVVQVESGALPTNGITSTDTTNWSGTTVPAGSCGL